MSGFDRKTGVVTSERWRSGVPMGGIGTGKIELFTDGSFGGFTINHNWDRPIDWVKGAFAAIFADDGQKKSTKMLRLASPEEYSGVENAAETNYVGLFPTASVSYADSELPVQVYLQAFSPLIPHNTADSSLPVACLEFRIKNPGDTKVTASIVLSWQNLLGIGGDREADWQSTDGNYQEVKSSPGGLRGIEFQTKQSYEDRRQNTVGSYFIGTREDAGVEITTCPEWDAEGKTVAFWKEFAATGRLGAAGTGLGGAVAATTTLEAQEEKSLIFYIVWFMPHHVTIRGSRPPKYEFTDAGRKEDVGHYYLNRFRNALSIADYVAENRNRLHEQTMEWQRPVLDSNLPFWLKQKMINGAFAIYACAILTKDGRFVVQESPMTMFGACGTMDQRMAAHAFMTQLFPELDMREMEIFAHCQDVVGPVADGRIPHFDGNVHDVIGDPNVEYGTPNWPDLSCSFIQQTLKLYRWTGDRGFLDRMYPHVKRALEFLKYGDTDGDFIPEGGSTYDYVEPFPGGFIYTASCYLGALKASIEMARVEGDEETRQACETRFGQLQESMMKNLWNGKFFAKVANPLNGEKNPNSFIAQLAGDWLSRLSGTGSTLPEEITESVVRETIARHVKPWKPVPPMEVTPDGELGHATCFILQHEPYIGCEAIYQGYTADGLEVIERSYEVAWEIHKNPWRQLLAYRAPDGMEKWLESYMTSPTTWHVLNALTGTTLDVPSETLYLGPRTSAELPKLHMPVYFSRFWAWLDYIPGKTLRLKVTKTFGEPVTISRVLGREGEELLKLPKTFVAKTGEVLDLDSIAGRCPTPKVVDYEIKAKEKKADGLQADSGPVVSG